MNLKVHFVSLSLSASVDQQTGSLSVFDVLEEIRTPQLPLQLQNLVISLAMSKEEREEFHGRLMIHLLTPDGKQQSVGSGDMQFPAEQRRMKAVFRFAGFPVTQYGLHRFVLSWVNQESKKVAEAILDFDVVQVTQPTQSAQGPGTTEKPNLAH